MPQSIPVFHNTHQKHIAPSPNLAWSLQQSVDVPCEPDSVWVDEEMKRVPVRLRSANARNGDLSLAGLHGAGSSSVS